VRPVAVGFAAQSKCFEKMNTYLSGCLTLKQGFYRSGEPLRYPKSRVTTSRRAVRPPYLDLQILLHAADTGHITFLHCFPRGDGPQVCPIVDERAGWSVKNLSLFRNDNHHVGRNANAWLGGSGIREEVELANSTTPTVITAAAEATIHPRKLLRLPRILSSSLRCRR